MEGPLDAVADTCFFIDLQRKKPNAEAWLEQNGQVRLVASVVTYGELAAGQRDRVALDQGLSGIPFIPVDESIAWIFGGVAQYLKSLGLMIGANDLWVAATALSLGMPVVTRNVAEFSRVPGLRVMGY